VKAGKADIGLRGDGAQALGVSLHEHSAVLWDGFATAGEDGRVRVWDAGTGEQGLLIGIGMRLPPFSGVAFSPDGKRIVGGSGFGGVNVWDAKSGWELDFSGGHSDCVFSVAFSPDSKRLASASC
jgi:WD40 repeat protein